MVYQSLLLTRSSWFGYLTWCGLLLGLGLIYRFLGLYLWRLRYICAWSGYRLLEGSWVTLGRHRLLWLALSRWLLFVEW